MNEIAIDIRHLDISYKELSRLSLKKPEQSLNVQRKGKNFYAVRDVTFSVERGRIVGIVGRNGSGKSTLLRAIAGIMAPDRGTIDIFDNTVSLLAIGIGFQPNLSGRENIFLSGLLLGFTKAEIEEKSDEIIEFCELGEFIDKPVKTYSSGMYSKLAFSITAVMETDIILIDEVLSVGDKGFQEKSYAKMRELISASDRTVIIVSHSPETIENLCDSAIWMHDGEIKMYGDTQMVLSEYDKIYTKKR
ncbi:MAG: ABC transporter ATP-binding protein [Christensenellales bacterium]|jgi:teichoic acid transport system ATP-binding protein